MISVDGNIKLLPGGISEIDQIIDLAKEIWIPSFESYFTDEQLWSLFEGMYNIDLLKKTLDNPHYHYYFISNANDEIIGYLALDFSNDSLKIDKIYVHPRLQGSGIGSKILAYLIDQYRNKRIWLRVNRGNRGAVKLYEKHGFKTIARKDFHGPGKYKYEDYIMEKAPF
jgi:ribosomal protein S18 acetylase RimI-like enzyme